MRSDRQLARLMAAMIVMIIAYVMPSAVQAHEGHRHGGHDRAAVVQAQAAPVAVVPSADPSAFKASLASTSVLLKGAIPTRLVALQADDAGRGCCPGPCKGACCGTMSCCAPGILSGSASLPALAFGHVVMASHNVDGPAGIGPEALPRPPRTLA